MEMTPAENKNMRDLVHDINGQIFLIRGYAELANEAEDSSQRQSNLAEIQAAADELEALFRKLRIDLGLLHGGQSAQEPSG